MKNLEELMTTERAASLMYRLAESDSRILVVGMTFVEIGGGGGDNLRRSAVLYKSDTLGWIKSIVNDSVYETHLSEEKVIKEIILGGKIIRRRRSQLSSRNRRGRGLIIRHNRTRQRSTGGIRARGRRRCRSIRKKNSRKTY